MNIKALSVTSGVMLLASLAMALPCLTAYPANQRHLAGEGAGVCSYRFNSNLQQYWVMDGCTCTVYREGWLMLGTEYGSCENPVDPGSCGAPSHSKQCDQGYVPFTHTGFEARTTIYGSEAICESTGCQATSRQNIAWTAWNTGNCGS